MLCRLRIYKVVFTRIYSYFYKLLIYSVDNVKLIQFLMQYKPTNAHDKHMYLLLVLHKVQYSFMYKYGT